MGVTESSIESSSLTGPPEISPLAVHKDANASYVEWQKYMEEMRDATQVELRQHGSRNEASILGE